MERSGYYFSVIMAVYNVELFLRDAVESLISQDIGFENIQLILVDDGSEDESGRLCDEYAARYPDNVVAVRKENGGVSSARNAGLQFIRGRYINFMDSDDMLSPGTMSAVFHFFESEQENTDVVSIPIRYFEGRTEDHPLNYKYSAGPRVIDLKKEWDAPQLSCSSAFFRREALEGLSFDTRIKYTEDGKFIQRVLIRKQTLGVVPSARYMYRYRDRGGSAIQSSQTDPNWYLPRLRFVFVDTFRFYREQMGYIPLFIQNTVMYDLQWVIRMESIPDHVLAAPEKKGYLDLLYSLFREIEDNVILSQHSLTIERKVFVLQKKYGRRLNPGFERCDFRFTYNGEPFYSLSDRSPCIDFLKPERHQCIIEGHISFFPFGDTEPSISAICGGAIISCEDKYSREPVYALGEPILRYRGFRAAVPLPKDDRELRVGFLYTGQGRAIRPKSLQFGPFSGLNNSFRHAYYAKNGWIIRYRSGELAFHRMGTFDRVGSELRYFGELLFGRERRSLRGAVYRLAYWLIRPWKRQPMWLISDREGKAGDNGEAFFRYMVELHPEIDSRFLLLKESPDYPVLSRIGKVIPADSRRRKLLCLLCDCQISSQAELINVRPFSAKDAPYRDIMADKPFVFLQHGIIKDDLSQWLKKESKNISGFITSAQPEYDSVVNGHYGYTEKEVWLTGLPRFDRLYAGKDSRRITIMPTWRMYLMSSYNRRTAVWEPGSRFYSSRFLSFYKELLNSERLIGAAERYGYTLTFFPHPNLQPYISAFKTNSAVTILGPETAYRNVYAESALVVTDYSSAVFDFVYMRRPVIYTQFDREEFFGGTHVYTEGYFNYERDGFGEVETDMESTVDRIIEYISSGCQMKEKYRERADRFFAFDDRENCRRVYERIAGMM